jgi:DNA primase
MSRIPESKIEEIQSASEIVSVVSRYVALKKAGKNFKGLCPFHQEKTPSFIVSPEKQIYHCFGCGKGGNIFNFLMTLENISYIEAIRLVAADLGISLPAYRASDPSDLPGEYDPYYQANEIASKYFTSQHSVQAQKYLESRKLNQETLQKYNVGYAPNKWDGLISCPDFKKVKQDIYLELGLIQSKEESKRYFDRFRNRIMFPFYNISGRIVGFGGRRLNENDQPKYLNSAESKIYKKGELLYGLYQAIPAIRERKTAIIVEGYFDLLRLIDSGISNVIASSGTALTEVQAKLIKRFADECIIAYDSDEAGINAAVRNSQILESAELRVSMIVLPKPFDPDTFILEYDKAAFIDLLRARILPIDYQLNSLQKNDSMQSPDEKQKIIDSLLEEYLTIPNQVKVGLTIHKIAEKMEIAESFLVSRFNDLKKRQHHRDRELREPAKVFAGTIKKGQWRAEEDLIAILLLNDAGISRYIFDHISTEDFTNNSLRDIFELIVQQWEDLGHLELKKMLSEINSEEMTSLISKLSLKVIEQPLKYASGCIYQMRKWHLDTRYNEILRLMKEEAESAKARTHYMKELTVLRQQISDVEAERKKIFNADF